MVVAHPWLAIFWQAPLLPLASQAARLDTSVPRGIGCHQQRNRPAHFILLKEWIGLEWFGPLRVILELPTDSIAQTDAGWDALDRFSKRPASDPRSERVISMTTMAEGDRRPRQPLRDALERS